MATLLRTKSYTALPSVAREGSAPVQGERAKTRLTRRARRRKAGMVDSDEPRLAVVCTRLPRPVEVDDVRWVANGRWDVIQRRGRHKVVVFSSSSPAAAYDARRIMEAGGIVPYSQCEKPTPAPGMPLYLPAHDVIRAPEPHNPASAESPVDACRRILEPCTRGTDESIIEACERIMSAVAAIHECEKK